MRRTVSLFRGSKGFSWYQNYLNNGGSDAFTKNTPPTAFNWKADIRPLEIANNVNTDIQLQRPKVFFNVQIGQEQLGNLVFELATDIVPKTVENFMLLCTENNSFIGKSYKGTKFHLVQNGLVIMGGDIENNDGTRSHSAYKSRFIEDENFIIPHSDRGLLSMASIGVNTNGSQFYISLNPTPYLNGRCVVFGKLVEGDSILSKIEKVFTFRGVPASDILITNCGIVKK